MDYKNFKKLKDDQHTATFQHPKGHTITVAKKGLSKNLRRDLDAIPLHMKDGGEVPDLSEVSADLAPDLTPAPQASPMDSLAMSAESLATPPMGNQPAELTGAAPAPQPTEPPLELAPRTPQATSPAPQGAQLPDAADEFAGGYTQGRNALQAQGNAEAESAKAQQQTSQRAADHMRGMATDFQTEMQKLDGERQAWVKELQDGKIDPNAYIKGMSTGSKVMTGIGLILSGMGSGITGGPNLAMQFLQKQIDNDIDAQKANLGTKKTLLEANLRQYGNLRDATDATRLLMSETVVHEMKAAALKSGDKAALARAQAAEAQWRTTQAPALATFAARRAFMANTANGEQDPARKLALMKMTGMIDDGQYSAANKELAQHEEVQKLKQAVTGSFHELSGKMFAGKLSPRARESAINTFAGRLAKLAEGRFNLEESKLQMDAIMPAAFESAETRRNKQQRLNAMFDSMIQAPTLQGLGLRPAAPPAAPMKPPTAPKVRK